MHPYPLLCVAVVFDWNESVGLLRAVWQVLLQSWLLVESGVAHMLVNWVYSHLRDVLRCLRGKRGLQCEHDGDLRFLDKPINTQMHTPWSQCRA